MVSIMNDHSLPWGKFEANSTNPFMNKSPKEMFDRIMNSTGNNTLSNNANHLTKRIVEGIFDTVTRAIGYGASSCDTSPQVQTLSLIPRHNITQLQPPHPPHPFTVPVSEWWHMHKAALVAFVIGLVLLVAMLAAAGIWFCCVKPRRKRMALKKKRIVEEGNVESEKVCDRGLKQQDGQVEVVCVAGAVDEGRVRVV